MFSESSPSFHPKYHYPGPRPLCVSPGLWPYLLVCVLAFQSCFLKSILLHTVARWISPKYASEHVTLLNLQDFNEENCKLYQDCKKRDRNKCQVFLCRMYGKTMREVTCSCFPGLFFQFITRVIRITKDFSEKIGWNNSLMLYIKWVRISRAWSVRI